MPLNLSQFNCKNNNIVEINVEKTKILLTREISIKDIARGAPRKEIIARDDKMTAKSCELLWVKMNQVIGIIDKVPEVIAKLELNIKVFSGVN